MRLPPALFVERAPLHFLEILHPQPGFTGVGFDENLYREYVKTLSQAGLSSYPDLAEGYVSLQTRLPSAILPPTRFLYIFCAYLWHQTTGADALAALKNISSLFSILTLVLTAIFSIHLGGVRLCLATSALMAFAPTQIHMSQHALIDGVFACVALACLWLLWENLQRPNDWRWLAGYGIVLALLVLTKENALFAYIGLLAVLAASYWFRIAITRVFSGHHLRRPTPRSCHSGESLRLARDDDSHLPIARQQSPSFPTPSKPATDRGTDTLIDLLIVSPIVLILALGAIFLVKRSNSAVIYLITFIAASFLLMANVRYGMNLRYANMWDMPLRFLARLFGALSARFRRAALWLALSVLALCPFDCDSTRSYSSNPLYELVTEGLLRAIQVLK